MSVQDSGGEPPFAASASRRIGINAHLLSDQAGYRRAGIHRYIYQVLRHLPPEEDVAYYVYTRSAAPALRRLRLIGTRWPTERRAARILWEQIAWPWLARRQELDLLHAMAFVTPLATAVPSVVTVYDLSFIHYPDRFPALQRRYLAGQTRRSCRAARRVIAISESSRQDVHRHFGVPLSRIDVVTPGVDERYRPLPAAAVDAFRRREGLPERFILHVGTLQPRKNLITLIEAVAALDDPHIPLVLVGGKGWFFERIFARAAALGVEDRVHFTGYVPDEALPLWYNAASLFAFPSVYEGFGLPVVEAMACGAPVLAAGVSSIPEAAGTAGLLFDPQDVTALRDRITAVLQDPELAATMRAEGLQHARRFSWARAGRQTAAVYRRALDH